jgi:hypothetical protein
MRILNPVLRRDLTPWWQIFTCVLLAGLFLYNPFLAAHQSHGANAVCHPPSHRATVGSSEMEKFTPQGFVAAVLPDMNAVLVLLLQVAASDSLSRHYVDAQVEASPQTGFSSSLWFRPPPVA